MTDAQIKLFLKTLISNASDGGQMWNDDIPPSQRLPKYDGKTLVQGILLLLSLMEPIPKNDPLDGGMP